MADAQALPRARGRPWKPGRPREAPSLRWWLRHQLWIPPVLGALVGAGLGVVTVYQTLPLAGVLGGVAWRATAAEARSMLSTVLGISLTSLSIVLSLSMLVVQNAAGQYSPRLLRLYLHSAGIRVVIPVFVATSVFCLVATHTFGFVSGLERAPRPALALAMLLLIVCEGALIFQVLQTLQLMRVENLVRQVRHDTLDAARMLERFRASDSEAAARVRARGEVPGRDWPLRARGNGFIASVDAGALLEVATAHQLTVHLERAVGEPVISGEEVGWLEAAAPGPPAWRESTESFVGRAIHLDRWRDADRDLALGVRQLVDVAIKALSPAINDPYTAVEAVDQLTFLLCELSGMRLGPRVLADASGAPRVFLHGLTLRDYLALATDQILRYGAAEPAVMLRLLRLAASVAQRARGEEDRRAAREWLHSILATSERNAPAPSLLRRHAEALEHALDGGPWPPLPAIGF
ncbi:DUF2254 domain-containing protein [Corallococcus sp. AB004]|uniref:DUF2254 domain-containing protein n=1 Tax=Corallococcus TaxID=83461 RepID=UPI000EA38234|nr:MULTISPECIES: DUF2254 domain-containing protein [Corallococcus]RKI33378.1 DUF2254 domain-containing protein [Corallococcus sp. AB004]NPC74787.1 DUF2254 domain-containing protein [Corallococcus exiguus]NPD28740.1 DUF2254 domain-containing protein [Corallococcus exiguus]NRD49303.1 DUF2254 domain-containing protein [Corallococcus exiguus]RKH98599.1 DUF2254 domain-containing protein [Corallococcus sp. AB038B]